MHRAVCLCLCILLSGHTLPGRAVATDIPIDGWVRRAGNVLMITGPLSTGISESFRHRLIEAVVYAGSDLPVILVLNSSGGREEEAKAITDLITLFTNSGARFESRVNYAQVCDPLCWRIIEAAGPDRIVSGVVWHTEADLPAVKKRIADQMQQQSTDELDRPQTKLR